jgi:hypothetical protein
VKLWQFSFNRLLDLLEVLTQGKERELLNWLFNNKVEYLSRMTQAKRDRYVEFYLLQVGPTTSLYFNRALDFMTVLIYMWGIKITNICTKKAYCRVVFIRSR